MTTFALTATERLVLNNLSRDPNSGTSATILAETLNLHRTSIDGVLRSLRDRSLVDYITRKRARHHFRTSRNDSPAATIAPGHSIDDAVASLAAAAQQCGRHQEALLAIARILAEAGICQELHTPEITDEHE